MSYHGLPPLGQAAMTASLPVVLASDQASIPVAATLAAETTKVIGTVNIAAAQTIGVTSAALTSIDGKIPALGQALAAASVPVVLTAAQLSTLTPPAAITGFLTESDFDTKVGSLTEGAPASDTASSGLNGRLQRIAQRLTSLIALLPASLGQKAMSASLAVTLASDQSTLPVSLASVPSHAVTNAGTFAVQVDGAALTALQLIDDIVQVDDAAFTPATSKIAMIGAEFDDTTPDSVDEGDGGAVRMSANRNLYVRIRDNAGNERGLNIDASGQIAVTLAASQTLATVTTVSTLTNITNWGNIVDNAGFTNGTTRISMNGYIYDEVAGTALTENDGAAARIDAKRAQVMVIEDVSTRGTTNRLAITTRLALLAEGPTAADAAIAANPMTVGGRASDTVPSAMSADGDVVNNWLGRRGETIASLEPKAFGGLSIYRTLDLDETEEDVKTSAGTLYGWFIFNAAATTRYIKIYNATAANVTVGSTTPVMTIPIPAGAAANVEFANGIAFSTAICIAATTGVADADTGAPAANDVIMNVFYK